MCRSMADIRSTAAEIRRGKKRKIEGKKLQGKNVMAPLLHRAAIKKKKKKKKNKPQHENIYGLPIT